MTDERPATHPTITPEIAAWTLAGYGYHATAPGAMSALLLRAIARMDPRNRAQARLAFPGYVDALNMAATGVDGFAELLRIAGPLASTPDVTAQYLSEIADTLQALALRVAHAAHVTSTQPDRDGVSHALSGINGRLLDVALDVTAATEQLLASSRPAT